MRSMPAISKIRLTNVVYEEGNKRYNDEQFLFDGHNSAILLENGGGKTVLIQTALQAIIPHTDLAERKIKNTLQLENAPAHIAIEWIINDKPRRYVVTAVTLFMTKQGLDSLRYVYEYEEHDPNGINDIPFVREGRGGQRTAERGEMLDYFSQMRDKSFLARTFPKIKEFRVFLEEQYHIISGEWDSIIKINSTEGGVESFFDECKNTNQLFDRLLIPTVENSISGHDGKLFADMFEKQHTSLKQYKNLKETIEENKRIQIQLDKYVKTFEQLHISKIAYEKVKQRAKGVWEQIQLEKNQAFMEQTDLFVKMNELKEQDHIFSIKHASYEIADEKIRLEELIKEYQQAFAILTDFQEKLAVYEKDYYSLKLAELVKEQKEFQNQLKYIEEEMEKLNQTEELYDLEDQLESAKRSLLGFFMENIDGIETNKQSLMVDLNPNKDRLKELKEEAKKLDAERNDLEKRHAVIESHIKTRTNDMESLEQQLLANPKQERVQDEFQKWIDRHQFLDDEMITLQKEEKQIQRDIKEAVTFKEELQKEAADEGLMRAKLSVALKTIEQKQQILITALSAIRTQWNGLENVYDQESTILSRLQEGIDKLTQNRNLLLYRERMALRFVDDHGDQKVFFGDTFIETQLKSLKNQFDYMITGAEYIQSLTGPEYDERKSYPLWPITLITTNKSKLLLQEKVKKLSDRLQFPIQVITTEDAGVIHKLDRDPAWIAPSHWDKGIEPVSFETWKEEIIKTAKETTISREEKEEEIKKWNTALQIFQQFITEYSFESYTSLNRKYSDCNDRIEKLKMKVEKQSERMNELETKLSLLRSSVAHHIDEKQGLEVKLNGGQRYLQLDREVEESRLKAQNLKRDHESISKKVSNVKGILKDVQIEIDDTEGLIRELNNELVLIKRDEQFLAVQSLRPLYSGESKSFIQEKVRNLNFKIRQINVSYGEWNAKLDNAKEGIKRTEKDIDKLKMEHSSIDEEQIFPINGQQMLHTLWGKIEKAKEEVKSATETAAIKSSAKEKQEGTFNTKLDLFKSNFSEAKLYEFQGTIIEVKNHLDAEKARLRETKTFLEQEKNRIEKTIHLIEEAERMLDRYTQKHHFEAPDIKAVGLTLEETMEFSYNRKKTAEIIVEELETAFNSVEGEKEKTDKEKQSFRQFCGRISDVKMRQMAENGVEHKHTYDDILNFKRNMLTSVERASNYAAEFIRKEDEQLQVYINQIHAHLKTLVEELKQIPKKTRVKVEDDWKQIFAISIPEWEEDDGRNLIRNHIEWILQQLESDRFLNDHGIQDDGKVRKEVEMWLQSKQLLQVVMKNEVMKVTCRKVTNDNKVTTRSYSWEQSNVWSGGEKWSKNMTLFLGILNYVAEKKQHIQPNMKRHRAVIMDNPFGKASSDHVLSPVFFIAEQLGFQIIALTAHAEGKFLQDFFPVIYSCRLRESADPAKKVMTKEKWLHQAYFQDHEPKSIERLGEMEQMALFE